MYDVTVNNIRLPKGFSTKRHLTTKEIERYTDSIVLVVGCYRPNIVKATGYRTVWWYGGLDRLFWTHMDRRKFNKLLRKSLSKGKEK